MEVKLFKHGSITSPYYRQHIYKLKQNQESSLIFALLGRRPSVERAVTINKRKPNLCDAKLITQKSSIYHDNWFERMAINHVSLTLQATTGLSNFKNGYDSLVEAAKMASMNFDANQQREIIMRALDRTFPRFILSVIRILLPQSKFTRELFAAFTTVFFAWLVGPSQPTYSKNLAHCIRKYLDNLKVKEMEFNGKKEKNVARIQKCRFLEQSNCVGMCTNLCKIPSQAFIKESLGMPVNIVPNFDDMSCEMIFGQDPPALMDDPALKQPCYKLCTTKQSHSVKCST